MTPESWALVRKVLRESIFREPHHGIVFYIFDEYLSV